MVTTNYRAPKPAASPYAQAQPAAGDSPFLPTPTPDAGMAKPNVVPGAATDGKSSALSSLMGQLGGGNTSTPPAGDSKAFIGQYTHLPWVGNDPSYWEGVIAKNGGLTEDNKAYWAQRMTDPPNVGSNAPNREGQAPQPFGAQQSLQAGPAPLGTAQVALPQGGGDSNLMALIAKLTGRTS